MYLLSSISVLLAFSLPTFSSPTGRLRNDATFKGSVVERLNGPPKGWVKDDSIKVDKDIEMVKLRIHLVQQGMDKFHDMAMKVCEATSRKIALSCLLRLLPISLYFTGDYTDNAVASLLSDSLNYDYNIFKYAYLPFLQIATPGHELYGGHLAQHVIDAMVAPKNESRDLVMQWLQTKDLSEHAEVSPRSDSIIVKASISQIEKLLDAEYSPFGMNLLIWLITPYGSKSFFPGPMNH